MSKKSNTENWIVGEPGGMNGPFYSVVKPNGNVVAMQIPDRKMAELIASIPELLRRLQPGEDVEERWSQP